MSKKIQIGPYIKSCRDPKTGEERYALSNWSRKHIIMNPRLAKILFTAESLSNEDGVFGPSKAIEECNQKYGFSPEFTFKAIRKLVKMEYLAAVQFAKFLVIKERLESERYYLELLIKEEKRFITTGGE